jgi:hypothetical protein
MNSGTDLAGNEGFTSITPGVSAMLATGVMSWMKLNLRLSYRVALYALSEEARRSV